MADAMAQRYNAPKSHVLDAVSWVLTDQLGWGHHFPACSFVARAFLVLYRKSFGASTSTAQAVVLQHLCGV